MALANEISKQEYLKRYLENEKDSERKRKKKTKLAKPKANIPRLKIIDEDIDLKSINFGEKADEDDGDEAPLIAEVIDERPLEEKLKELYESSRWKKINSDEVSQSSSTVISGSSDLKSGIESTKKHLNTDEKDFDISRQTNKVRHDSDDDLSPPRNQEKSNRRHDSDNEISSLRNQDKSNKRRHDSDNEISPLRNHKRQSNRNTQRDISPPPSHKQNRKCAKHDSDSDISPPRSHKQSRKSAKYDSDSDISPPRSHKQNRGSTKHNSDSDISPPRYHRSNETSSQTKNKPKRHNSDSDISPPRHRTVQSNNQWEISKRHDSDSDRLPPRQKIAGKSKSPVKSSSRRFDSDSDDKLSRHQNDSLKCRKSRSQGNSDSDISPPRSPSKLSNFKGKEKKLNKTLSGLRAGLQNSEMLQQEAQELRKREKSHLNMLDDEISGRNANTIIRDRKTGMKRDLNKEQEAKAEENKKTKEYEQKYNKWGKGVEQAEDKMEKFKDDLYEMSKPLARYQDDEDLDKRLKSIIHDDDPMAEYIKKKKKKDAPNVPVYSGPPAPPNRFGILPGYRWDGVDRSNGFEKKYFEKINTTKAVENEAYLWSVQDM